MLDQTDQSEKVAVTKESRGPNSPADRFWNGLWWAVVVNVFVLPNVVAGQTIDTNRPGFSFSPNVVGPGQLQLETGITYIRFDDDIRITSLPLAEIRIGVADQLEVFVSSLSWSEASSANNEASGLVDMVLGTKVNINSAADKTRMAFLFQLSVPTGDDIFSSDRWDPSVAFVWAHNGDLAIAGTVKVSEFRSGYQLDNGLKMPFSWGDAHSGFVEWEMNLPEDGGSSHWLNGGYQWLIDDRMQLDFNAGLGLNDRAGDYRLGVGFSIRL
jgi:hypothetical protein